MGRTPVLRLTGRLGQEERGQYLRALAGALEAGECAPDEAVAELHELSEPWMREVVRSRIRRLPAHADPQTTEHWLWMEWHGALGQFDATRVESFPAYVALRLRMALAAAAREDDPLPRKARARLRAFEHMEDLVFVAVDVERRRFAVRHTVLDDADPVGIACGRYADDHHGAGELEQFAVHGVLGMGGHCGVSFETEGGVCRRRRAV